MVASHWVFIFKGTDIETVTTRTIKYNLGGLILWFFESFGALYQIVIILEEEIVLNI